MKKDIPHVYANPLNRKINNQKEIFYSSKEERSERTSPVVRNKNINTIFNSPNYVYKKTVIITTLDGEKESIVIGKTNSYLLTKDNEKIYFTDIIDIKEK